MLIDCVVFTVALAVAGVSSQWFESPCVSLFRGPNRKAPRQGSYPTARKASIRARH